MRMTRDNGLFQCECLSLAISSLPPEPKMRNGPQVRLQYYLSCTVSVSDFRSLYLSLTFTPTRTPPPPHPTFFLWLAGCIFLSHSLSLADALSLPFCLSFFTLSMCLSPSFHSRSVSHVLNSLILSLSLSLSRSRHSN